MSAIDTQNAKQIRDPMQVLISLDVPDTITMGYSGYTGTAKVYDTYARLSNAYKSWPMRKLADLQADGFPLDGSCALYNSSITPSLANGKLGVRGHTGQTLDLTASALGTIPIKALSLYVTGAASVTYGGTTASITGNQVVIQVNASSVSLSFTPVDSTHRVEVSAAVPGTSLVINNANMISATVSLRSDLSLYNQTLPESELNVEVYNDVDISEAVAGIPDDTPITYQAGYAGDMSPERKFYIAGQVTWKDNVLSIHAVDAVHFLDNVSIRAPQTNTNLSGFVNIALNLLKTAGVDYYDYYDGLPSVNGSRWIVTTEFTAREYIAFCNNYLNLTDYYGDLLDGSGSLNSGLQFTYVDAGRPCYMIREHRDRGKEINEDDCTDLTRDIERPVAQVKATVNYIVRDTVVTGDGNVQKVGSASWVKNVGASLSFEKYATSWLIGLFLGANQDNDVVDKLKDTYGTLYSAWKCMYVTVPGNAGTGWNAYGFAPSSSWPYYAGQSLPYTDIPQEAFDTSANKYFSSFVPWNQPYNGTWNYDGVHTINSAADSWNVLVNAGIVRPEATSIDLDIYGAAYDFTPTDVTYSSAGNGVEVTFDKLPLLGKLSAKNSNNSAVDIFPQKMLKSPMYRSNVTGSFKWKGDPRLQPREIVYFNRLDGTYEKITLENITLHHEGGGTWADITYRKGAI